MLHESTCVTLCEWGLGFDSLTESNNAIIACTKHGIEGLGLKLVL